MASWSCDLSVGVASWSCDLSVGWLVGHVMWVWLAGHVI